MDKLLKNRLEIGDEVIYFDCKTIMELTSVVSIDRKNKTATLKNNVLVSRHPNNEQFYPRIDKKVSRVWKKDSITMDIYNSFQLKKKLYPEIAKLKLAVMDLDYMNPEEAKAIIKIYQKINKLNNLCAQFGK